MSLPRTTTKADPFPQALRALRLERNHTQESLGLAVGVSEAQAAKWERGENTVPAERIEALVKELRPDDPDRFRFLAYLQFVPAEGRYLFREA